MTAVEVAPGVWRAGTRYVNWYLVDDADGLTVVDCGLPGYRGQLAGVLRQVGRQPSDVRALVLTHGHIDHVGSAGAIADTGATVYLHPADAALAADPRKNKTDRPLLPYLRWPATAAFVAHCVSQGVLRPDRMPPSEALTEGLLADVPGTPVVSHTPGHTDGSCVLEFPNHGVLFVGDLLCTVSPKTGASATPQLQSRASNRSSEQAMTSLSLLEGIDAPLILPGHGTPFRGGVEAAVSSARLVGCL